MQIETLSIERVKPYERNPRLNDDAVADVAASLKEYGWQQPLVVDREGSIICGHTRLKAALKLGLSEVPVHIASVDIGVEQALLLAMREFKEMCLAGWPRLGATEVKLPDTVWIDAGYMAPVVYAFCREVGQRFRPSVGRGAAQQRTQWYNRPTQTGSVVKYIGEGFHMNYLPAEQLLLAEVDADYWKTWVQERLKTPVASPGAMHLFQGSGQEHLSLAKHLTSERKIEEFVAGKGTVVRWERLQKNNHWFDPLYNPCAAGYGVGVRLIAPLPKPVRRNAVINAGCRRPNGRPWVDLSRWHGIERSQDR